MVAHLSKTAGWDIAIYKAKINSAEYIKPYKYFQDEANDKQKHNRNARNSLDCSINVYQAATISAIDQSSQKKSRKGHIDSSSMSTIATRETTLNALV